MRSAIVRTAVVRTAVLLLSFGVVAAACGGDSSTETSDTSVSTDGDSRRSSGGAGTDGTTSPPVVGSSSIDGPVGQTPASVLPPPSVDAADTDDPTDEGDSTDPGAVSLDRSDGIELLFDDGSLGPATLGSTIEEVEEALGPAFTVSPEETIRTGFPSGYSISSEGEVMFWAVEEDGILTLFMTNNPRVGLDSGLRPKLPLDEAIRLHGDPVLTLGEESREFAEFPDGTGDGSVSVLVAIGEFGGPVGVYPEQSESSEAESFELEGANIKELWFR